MSYAVSQAEVLVRVEGRVGRLTLNRPRALNALTTEMCRAMIAALGGWLADDAVDLVLIDHAGDRGFCAGGDIRRAAQSVAGDGREARAFFFTEYRLNELLFRYPKPVVTVMDGVTMGGGVGIAWPAGFRVSTERTVLAMPETAIGLFCDIGAGWRLARLPDQVGVWLALTGARLGAADCGLVGLATHHVESGRLGELKAALLADPDRVDAILQRFGSDAGPAPLEGRRAEIRDLFGQQTVEAIFAALATARTPWAQAQLAVLRTRSPQALKVSLRLLQAGGAATDFAAHMAMEYRAAARVILRPDFREGVRAVIVDKDNAPRWRPETLEAVTEPLLDGIFAALPAGEEWTPAPDRALAATGA